MAYPEFLTGAWQESVRRVCGGASVTDVPDALLADDMYGPDSEDFIKDKIPTWATLKTTYAVQFRRATIYHIAQKVDGYLQKKFKQSETFGRGEYGYSLPNIDWVQEGWNHLEKCLYWLKEIDSTCVADLITIDLVSPATAMYEEMEIEEY